MEPSSSEDGDARAWVKLTTCSGVLQWSRPHLRTETCVCEAAFSRIHAASMEPSSSEDGDRIARVEFSDEIPDKADVQARMVDGLSDDDVPF